MTSAANFTNPQVSRDQFYDSCWDIVHIEDILRYEIQLFSRIMFEIVMKIYAEK